MNQREKRFFGTGNVWMGEGANAYRGWRLQCSLCHDAKTVGRHDGSMAPALIVKKFTQAGWEVGKKPGRDLCDKCNTHRNPKHERQLQIETARAEAKLDAATAARINGSPTPEAPKSPAQIALTAITAIRREANGDIPVEPPSQSDVQHGMVRVRKLFLRQLNASLHTIRDLLASGERSRADDYLDEAIAALTKYITTPQRKPARKEPEPVVTEPDTEYAAWLAEHDNQQGAKS